MTAPLMDGLSQLVAQVMSPRDAANAPRGMCAAREERQNQGIDGRHGDENRNLVYAGRSNCLEQSLDFPGEDLQVRSASDISAVDPGRVDSGCDVCEVLETAEASREDPSESSMRRSWLDEKAEREQRLTSGPRQWTSRVAEMLESEAEAVRGKLERVAKTLRDTWIEACEQVCRGGALSRAARTEISSDPGRQAGFSTWVHRARAGATGKATNAGDRSWKQGRDARVLTINGDGRTSSDCSSPTSLRSNFDFQSQRRGIGQLQENLEPFGSLVQCTDVQSVERLNPLSDSPRQCRVP